MVLIVSGLKSTPGSPPSFRSPFNADAVVEVVVVVVVEEAAAEEAEVGDTSLGSDEAEMMKVLSNSEK